MKKDKWYRIAVSGQTTDEREIQREWIEQMAESYDPQKYGARINVEHFRGFYPDSDFGAYGDVLALKSDTVMVDGEERLALFAQIKPNDKLKALNAKNQKIYTSVEIDTNFAGSGKAYLVGLAVTDSPASLGTEMLQFAAGASVNPLNARKLNASNLFSAAIETDLSFNDDKQADGLADQIFNKLKKLFGDEQANQANKPADEPSEQTDETAKEQTDEPSDVDADAIATAVYHSLQEHLTAQKNKISELEQQIIALNQLLETLPQTPQRPVQTGTTDAVVVDC